MNASRSDPIDDHAQDASLSDGTPCRILSVDAVRRLAANRNVSGRMVEIAALRQDIVPERYLRNLKTLDEADQRRLLESTLCVVGLGGLGGLVTETLARMGVGRLHLVDGDHFEAHNLNRQLLSSNDDIGTSKAEAAALRVHRINPGIEVVAQGVHLTAENADALLDGCHIVVDCLDNIPSRFIVAAAAKRAGIPMVSAAVAGICGHVTTIFPDDPGLTAIFGPETELTEAKGVETQLGCLAPGVNLIASLEALEASKVLLKKTETLRGRLLLVDLGDYTFETFPLAPME